MNAVHRAVTTPPQALPGHRWLIAVAAAVAAVGLAACGSSAPAGAASASNAAAQGAVSVVAAENEYGDVASQIGGRFVRVTSVESNPNTDPHTYEVSPDVASEVSAAGLVIENGLGYDDYMGKLESASPSSHRKTINVQMLVGLPDSTPNPHLWYDPGTMPAVARAIGGDLSQLDPAHAAYFRVNVTRFDASLKPWYAAIAGFKARYAGTRVATTEPVADYLLTAMGIDNLTPFQFQADIMNGTDPSPQGVSMENGFVSHHQVKVFVYNQQVIDSLTESIRASAQRAGVPVVGVYETMPTPGYTYQSWMLAETRALQAAVVNGTSTLHL